MTRRQLRRSVGALLAIGLGLAGCGASGAPDATSGTARGAAGGTAGGTAGRAPGPAAGSGGPASGSAGQAAADGAARDRSSGEPSQRWFGRELDPAQVPGSTFAMDVDTASWSYARDQLAQGTRPAPGRVRPEEFVNALRQHYPQPAGDGFTVTLDGARLPAEHRTSSPGDVRLLRVGLQTRAEDAERPDAALTLVVDVSGSMGGAGKLDVVRQALHAFVDATRPTDSLAIVAFDDRARVLRPTTAVRERADLHAAIDRLEPGGSTDLERGLVTGYRVARDGFRPGATNRVVLLSDGLANVGNTQATPILSQVAEEAAKQITLLGVAVGNDYGDALMEQLADRGDGFVVYAGGLDGTRRAFVETLPATHSVRALDAKVQVTFDPRTVAGYRLVGYDDRVLDARDFRDDRVDGGEVFAGHSVTALYTVRLRPGAGGHVAHTQLRWQDPRSHQPAETGADVSVADLAAPLVEAGGDLQASYAAAFLAEKLRGSPYGDDVPGGSLTRIADLAAGRAEDAGARDLAAAVRRAVT